MWHSRDTMHATKDIRRVALLLGHETTKSTEIYLRADPEERLKTVEAALPPDLKRGIFPAEDELIAWLSGFGWACFGIMIAGYAKSIENFNYVVSAVLTPLFLVAGTFFPISNLPRWAQILADINPLHHCVELVRHAAFGFEAWDLARVGALVLFAAIIWRIAIHAMTRKLID